MKQHLRNVFARRTGTAGLTMIEMCIVVSLLGVIFGALAMATIQNEKTFQTGSLTAHLEAQIATAIERTVVELRVAANETLAPALPPGTSADSIDYLQATDRVGGVIVWSAPRRLAFEYETSEVDDGVDNNGNGLVDEGRVVVTEDVGGPAQKPRIVTRWVREFAAGELGNGIDDNGNGLVDERGFYVERTGESLNVQLTLQRMDANGRLASRTARTSVRLRN